MRGATHSCILSLLLTNLYSYREANGENNVGVLVNKLVQKQLNNGDYILIQRIPKDILKQTNY